MLPIWIGLTRQMLFRLSTQSAHFGVRECCRNNLPGASGLLSSVPSGALAGTQGIGQLFSVSAVCAAPPVEEMSDVFVLAGFAFHVGLVTMRAHLRATISSESRPLTPSCCDRWRCCLMVDLFSFQLRFRRSPQVCQGRSARSYPMSVDGFFLADLRPAPAGGIGDNGGQVLFAELVVNHAGISLHQQRVPSC